MTPEERRQHNINLDATLAVMREVAGEPISWWWISFTDTTGFLGAAIVQGHTVGSALTRAHELGVNPGGEAVLAQIGPDLTGTPVRPKHTDRLLSREQIDQEGLL